MHKHPRSLVTTLFALILILMTAQQSGAQIQKIKSSALYNMNEMQYGSGRPVEAGGGGGGSQAPMYHKHFMATQQAVKQAKADPTTPSYNNSGAGHTPSTSQAQDQSQQVDPDKFPGGNKMEYAKGGSPPDGPCCGPPGSQAGSQNFYFNSKKEFDGRRPVPPFRVIPPQPGTHEEASPTAYAMDHEMMDQFANSHAGFGEAGQMMQVESTKQQLQDDLASEAGASSKKAGSAMQGMAEGASEAMADEFNPTWYQMLDLSATPLINVGNEASGAACSASQPIKTHANAVYLVQQAYKYIYLPIALLLLLPGAVATQMKGLIAGGILQNSNDEDAVSPFAGILRSMIAIFLIPASQMIVSYSIDVGNSTQYEISRNINYGNLFMYADAQVFRAPLESFPGKILPRQALQSLGKMTGKPEKMAKLFNLSPASVMLQMLANSMAQAAAFGLVILCAFQIVMACYMLLMGPVAAAFYAWPSGTGSLFSKVFANWCDAMVNLALWRFWWCIVLLVMDTRLGWLMESTGFELYSEWELLMFISFLVIMTYVPFNPFDFKPGDMVQKIMDKADEAVQEAANKK